MTVTELRILIQTAGWFSNIGEPDYMNIAGYVKIPNLDDWRHVTGMIANEPVPRLIDQGMEWLPTQLDQSDPVHGQSLKVEASASGKTDECSALALELYTLALAVLRHVDSLSGLRSLAVWHHAGSKRGSFLIQTPFKNFRVNRLSQRDALHLLKPPHWATAAKRRRFQ